MPKRQPATRNVTTPYRLEAFSDGVLAIVITIMALDLSLHVPATPTFAGWRPQLSRVAAYVLSFVFIAQYWNNHHQLLRSTKEISRGILWANMHLLFWLSLVPVVTAWIGTDDHYKHGSPVVAYGAVALMSSMAYAVMGRLLRRIKANSEVVARVGRDKKGLISLIIYAAGVLIAAIGSPIVGIACYVAVSVVWLIPDRRLGS